MQTPQGRHAVKISTKGLYGTLAVFDLAIHSASGNVHKADIAERQQIPEQYLAQLLSALRRAGYIKSVRGPAGGHLLAKQPGEITVGEIVELLDGPQVNDATADVDDPSSRRVIQSLFNEADRAAADVLASVTFDDLVARWRDTEGAIDFII